jgi:hypothetical protein
MEPMGLAAGGVIASSMATRSRDCSGGPFETSRAVLSRPCSRQKSAPAMSPWPYQKPRCQAWSVLSPSWGSSGQPRESVFPETVRIGYRKGLSYASPQ